MSCYIVTILTLFHLSFHKFARVIVPFRSTLSRDGLGGELRVFSERCDDRRVLGNVGEGENKQPPPADSLRKESFRFQRPSFIYIIHFHQWDFQRETPPSDYLRLILSTLRFFFCFVFWRKKSLLLRFRVTFKDLLVQL